MTISAGDLVLPGNVEVSVFNPAPGGGESPPEAFSVLSAFAPPLQFWLPLTLK